MANKEKKSNKETKKEPKFASVKEKRKAKEAAKKDKM